MRRWWKKKEESGKRRRKNDPKCSRVEKGLDRGTFQSFGLSFEIF